ncbi:MAG: hypothetical protein JWQ49_94 [Edaphobacter sp.]|nr:hypothetical protein [Edaphobacter sp.]
MTKAEQITKIHSFLRRMFVPGDLIEIRGLKSRKGTLRMLTDDLYLAARSASAMEKEGADVYYCLNPVDRESKYAKTAKINDGDNNCRTAGNADTANRNAYLIDIDPDRPSGEAATKEQRAAALSTAQEVHTFLAERGWPDPIVLDSGNGIHMLYKGNRCSANDDALKFALKRLATLFNGTCKIDAVVSNPARISRMPFCINKKAGRRASLVSIPNEFEEMLPYLVLRLAEEEPTYMSPFAGSSSRSSAPAKGSLVIDEEGVLDLIDEFPDQLELDRDPSYSGDATYFALSACPFKGAPHVGQAVGMGKTTIILRPNSIGFKCFSGACADHTFADLLRLLYKETGRRFSGDIWEDDLEVLDKRWGCVEDLTAGANVPDNSPFTVDDFLAMMAASGGMTILSEDKSH